MQKADDNHENGDYDSDLEFDPWEEDEFLDDPETPLEGGAPEQQPPLPQDDMPKSSASTDISENPPSATKKKTSRNLALLLLLLAGGSGAGYYFLNMNTASKAPPVVRLDTQETALSPVPQSDNDADLFETAIPTPVENPSEVPANADTPAPAPQITIQEQPVLTPLPDNIEDSAVELAPLDEPEQNDDATSNQNSPQPVNTSENPFTSDQATDVTNEAKADLSEEEGTLLSKTEEAPRLKADEIVDDMPSPAIEESIAAPATIDSPETAPKNPPTLETAAPKEAAQPAPVIPEKKTMIQEKQAQVKEASPQVKLPEWEIRGANPQSAVLYEKNSGETRTVEPGDSVRGLGKIKAIAKENGLWVVTGTHNKVKQ